MTPPDPIRVATRGSALALRQAGMVRQQLEALGATVEIVTIETRGDREHTPFRQMAGQGFFTKAVQEALLAGAADVAVHSYKDLPSAAVPGLAVVAVCARADARDTLLVRPEHLDAGAAGLPLRPGARVGTGSVRRRRQLSSQRADLELMDLRGNVPTRIERLRTGEFHAIVVAAAGLQRLALDLGDLEVVALDPHVFVPAPAQGALALEAPTNRLDLAGTLRALHDAEAGRAIEAERRLMAMFDGGCQLALGAYATVERDITLHAWYRGAVISAVHATPTGAAELAYEALGRPDSALGATPS